MINVKKLLEESPFKNKLRLSGVSEAANAFHKEPFIIVCDEKSRPVAVKIKESAGLRSNILEISTNRSDNSMRPFKKGENLLIVGGKDLVSAIRRTCKCGDNRLIAVLLDFSIAESFKNIDRVIKKEGAIKIELCPLEEVIVDLKYLFNSSRASYADAFFECAAISALKLDAQLFSLAEKKAPPSTEYEDGIIGLLKNCKENNLFSSLVCAEIILAKLYADREDIFSNGLYSVANVLKKTVASASFAECAYAASKALLSLYSTVSKVDMSNSDIMPDYVKRIQGLCDLYGDGEGNFFIGYSPYTEEAIHQALSEIASSELAKEAISSSKSDISKLEKISALCYGGKKKRADFTRPQISFAIAHGGFLSQGFLKYVCDAGITEALI